LCIISRANQHLEEEEEEAFIFLFSQRKMIKERSQKSDRYHSSFFSLFRTTTTLRSQSFDSVYDHNRGKRGKRKI
jgi:hypothetical protein